MSAERVIKFRAWRNQQMSKPFTLGEGVCWPDGSVSTAVKLNVMQFTGLHDKNGKEIYEGDIVKNKDPVKSRNFIIRYIQDGWCLDSGETPRLHNYIFETGSVEVIGNIYENPELLEQP